MIRNAYLKKTESKFEDLTDRIDGIAAKAASLEGDAKVAYEEQLAALRAKEAGVRRLIQGVREADAGNWGPLKSGVNYSLTDLTKAVDHAVAVLRKIA